MVLIVNVKNKEHIGSQVELKGWVYRKMSVGGKIFIVLRDSSDIIQCVIDESKVNKETWDSAKKITRESSCIVKGVVKADPRAPGGYEIQVEKLKIVGLSNWFPIRGTEGVDYLLDHRHLWIRSRKLLSSKRLYCPK